MQNVAHSDRREQATGQDTIARDLHESRATLNYERDLLKALLDSSPDAIYFKDLGSRIIRMSTSKARKLIESVPKLHEKQRQDPELDPVDIVAGITDFDTYAAADAQRAYDDEQEIIRTGQPLVSKLEKQVFQDGSTVWYLTHKLPWRDRSGAIIGTFGVSKDVTDLKRTEENLERVNKELVTASRHAGMAEVATGVLHNVGNTLNSINVSATLAFDQLRASHASRLGRVSELLLQHSADLGRFLTSDEKGRKLPTYIAALATTLTDEQNVILREIEEVRRNIDHIKEVVTMQQDYAKVAGALESLPVAEIIDDAVRMTAAALARHQIELVREIVAQPVIVTDRHKVLQILINLLHNAKYACGESARADRRVRITLTTAQGWVTIRVADNGIGIPPENRIRIFSHGFTTRKDGHGFGLHSGALTAKELGGTLTAESAGRGHGATFTLTLPDHR